MGKDWPMGKILNTAFNSHHGNNYISSLTPIGKHYRDEKRKFILYIVLAIQYENLKETPRHFVPIASSGYWIAAICRGYFLMKEYLVKVSSVTPYLQHRMDDVKLEQWVKQRGPIYERYDISSPEIVADFHSHIQFDGEVKNYFIPSDHFRISMIESGKMVKGKVGGATKSMSNVVAAMFNITPFQIPLPRWDQFDKRSAVNRNIKGRVIVIRPQWNKWNLEFTLLVDEDSIQTEMVEKIITYSGKYIGIGSYRPQNKGPFGRYKLDGLTLS
jgi:hypothetical protein